MVFSTYKNKWPKQNKHIIPITPPPDYTLHIVIVLVAVLVLSLYTMSRQFQKRINTTPCKICHYQTTPDKYISSVIAGGKL